MRYNSVVRTKIADENRNHLHPLRERRVLDFFAGSGSTAEAAGIAGHRSMSIEVDPAVVEGVFSSRFEARLFTD